MCLQTFFISCGKVYLFAITDSFLRKFAVGGFFMQRTYAYVRVSTKEQNEERQRLAMLQFGVSEDSIFSDRQSGKDFKRPAYTKLIKTLRPGDLLVIKSIDRLGRNYEEILEQWRIITKEIKAEIVVLDMPLLDTRASRDLTGALIADIVLELLSYVAQTEREFIHQRQSEGIAAAKARGVHLGRPPKDLPEEFGPLYRQLQQGSISLSDMAESLGVSIHQLYRMRKKYEARLNTG